MGYSRIPSTLRRLQKNILAVPSYGPFRGELTLPPTPSRLKEGGLRLEGKYKSTEPDRPLVSIVSPVFNAASTLRETIESVLDQSYDNVEYIIIDGASTDGTVSILEEYSDRLDYWISEPDNGMYDALQKGLRVARGDIVAYINAGDYYHRCALSVVAKIMVAYPTVLWLTGKRVEYNAESEVINVDTPNIYRRALVRSGWYGPLLPFIQQESTFWRRDAMGTVNPVALAGFKYAGDYYLWYCFSALCDLSVVNSYLGGFKIMPGQLSADRTAYFAEVSRISDSKKLWHYLLVLRESMLWYLPVPLKKRFSNGNFFTYSQESRHWVG